MTPEVSVFFSGFSGRVKRKMFSGRQAGTAGVSDGRYSADGL